MKRVGKDSGAAQRAAVTMGKTQTPLSKKPLNKRHYPALLSISTGTPGTLLLGVLWKGG